MKHNLRNLVLVLAAVAAFIGLVAAQEKTQKQSGGTVTWRLATVDAKGMVHCETAGWNCATSFLVADRNDAELAKYTVRINALLAELRDQNKDKTREPVFIATPYVPFLAWCRRGDKVVSSEQAITLKDSPDRFYLALGISKAMARYKNAESRWYYQTPDGVYWCRINGTTQLAAALLNADTLTPSHDRMLADYTNRINAILVEAAKHRSAPDRVLSLLVTPEGLLLAWSRDDNGTGPLPKGSITSHD
jgi:hypothetical protein